MAKLTPQGDRPARPLRRDAELNRQRVIAAAREIFAERGLVATLDEVAHRAGVGVGTVYRRFPDKEALLAATFEDRLDDIVRLAEESLAFDDGWSGLVHFLRRSVEMQAADRGLRDVALAAGYGPESLAKGRDRIVPLASRLVERAQAEGSLRPDVTETDLPPVVFMLTDLAHNSASVRVDLSARYLQIFIDGLHSRASGSELGAPLTQDDVEAFGRGLNRSRGRHPSM